MSQTGTAPSFASAFLNHIDESIFTLDTSGRILHVNAAWATSLGDPSLDLVGERWPEIWDESIQPHAAHAIDRAKRGAATRFETPLFKADGSPRWAEISVKPVFGAQGAISFILAVARDITSFKNREEQLERAIAEKNAALAVLAAQHGADARLLAAANAQAAHSEKIRFFGQFVGNLVHDFNNVLSVVSVASRFIKRKASADLQDTILAPLDQAVDRGVALVRQMLDFARVDGAEPEIAGIAELLATTRPLLEHLLGENVSINFAAGPDCWPVLVSPSRLQAVLLNLAANARDAMTAGGVLEISATNCFSVERPPGLPSSDYVRICVRDNGVGMTPEVLKRAGEPYFTTKPSGKGTGLGLPSAFDLARHHGGAVLISSEPGRGASITIYLPRALALGEPVATPDDAVDPVRHGNATILLVEHDELVRRHLAETLRQLGYQIIESGREDVSIALLTSGVVPDIACIDLELAEGDARHLTEALRKVSPDLPVMYLSGRGSHGVRNELVFRKPLDEALLARAILEKLGRAPATLRLSDVARRTERLRERIRDPRARDAYDSWVRLRGERKFTSAAHVDEVAAGLEEKTCHLEIRGDPAAPTFRFLKAGSSIVEKMGRDLVGVEIPFEAEAHLGPLPAAYRRALDGVPYFEYARIRLDDERTLLFERLILPFSGDGLRATLLLGIITFEELGRPNIPP